MSVLLVSNILFYIVITTFTWGFYWRAWSAFCMIFSWTPHSTIFNSPKCLHQILYLAIFSVFGTFRACIWVPQILPSGVSLERSSKIKFWWDVPILIFILMWNLELLPKVRTFEGKAVQRKQKQFWNLWKKMEQLVRLVQLVHFIKMRITALIMCPIVSLSWLTIY